MKKIKLLVAVAIAGLLGLSARAAVSGYDLVTVKGTVLAQTNDTYNSKDTVTYYNVAKFKVTNKTILNLIAMEYVTNFPSGFPAGAQLAVDYFFNGEFYVLDKNGNILLANAGAPAGADDYSLYFEYGNYVDSGSDTASKETDNYTTIGEFYYEDATDANYFDIYGLTTVKDIYGTKDSESFNMTGMAGDGYINDTEVVVSGTVKGSGKNVDD
jgi:hypothetical protein